MDRVLGLPGAFEEEFGSLYRLARTVAFRILGSVAESEDAAAEALTRALVDWHRVGRLPHREAWVQRVAANEAIDVVRRRGPADRAVAQIGSALTSGGSAGSRSAPGGSGGATGFGGNRDDESVLRMTMAAALAELPRRQREAIVLRHLLGYPEAEVAAVLGVSPNSVKKHLQRGMEKLRRSARTDATMEGGIDAAFE